VSKSISSLLILTIVTKQDHIYVYCILYGIAPMLVGFLSMVLVHFKLKLRFKKVALKEVIDELKDGWYIFTTSAMSKIFNNIGITVLGYSSSGMAIVGAYSAIQKLPYTLAMLYAPIGQVIFPRSSQLFLSSFKEGKRKVLRLARLVMLAVAAVSVIFILFSHEIVLILYGEEFTPYAVLMTPLIGWLFLSILNNFLGIQILVASGHEREYSLAFRWAMVAIVLLSYILGTYFGGYGVAWATLLAELVLTVTTIYQIFRIQLKQ